MMDELLIIIGTIVILSKVVFWLFVLSFIIYLIFSFLKEIAILVGISLASILSLLTIGWFLI